MAILHASPAQPVAGSPILYSHDWCSHILAQDPANDWSSFRSECFHSDSLSKEQWGTHAPLLVSLVTNEPTCQSPLILSPISPSVQFRHSIMSNSLRPHGLQLARLPCPSPAHKVCSNSCPLSWVMPSNHLMLCCPLLFPPSIFRSIRVFSNESVLHIRWPKYWSFSFTPSNEYSGLISFRIDWLDLLAVQGTLKSLLQPQLKSINSLALHFLYCPILTTIHDYWKNYSFD